MSISFKVAPKVKEGDISKLKNGSLAQCAKLIAGFWKKRNTSSPALELEVGRLNHENVVLTSTQHMNGFIDAVLTAYNHHLPLVLSVEDFWMLIALGVSQFLGGDPKIAEKYRHVFVDHEGKETLTVRGEPFGIAPKCPKSNRDGWPMFIDAICGLIEEKTKTDVAEILKTPFSNTDSVTLTAMRVTLMESMKNYFEYRCMLMCGIPKLTLEGTVADYQAILDRIHRLAEVLPDFKWYLNRVAKHMESVMATVSSKGDIKKHDKFWRTMILDVEEGSGGQRKFTGWLADFIPFRFDPKGVAIKNAMDWNQMDFEDCNTPAVTFTDFILEDGLYTMKQYDMKLVGGFFGVAKDDTQKAIRPATGWATYYWKEKPL